MAAFGIEIRGDFTGGLVLHTWFNDENEIGSDTYIQNVINIARELEKAIRKLQALQAEKTNGKA